MTSISKFKDKSTQILYDLEDSTARAGVAQNASDISDLNAAISNAIPYNVKQAIKALFNDAGYGDDDGHASEKAVITAWADALTVVSISAVYTQSGTVYDYQSLNDLKSDLVVTATFDNNSTSVVTNYTLSGTLTSGTSTITVAYEDKTTTFTVTVTGLFDKWSYSLSNGDLIKVSASISYEANTGQSLMQGPRLQSADANRRRSYVVNYGIRSYPVYYNTTLRSFPSEYYPIPVPPTATKVTISITPNTQFTGPALRKWDATNELWSTHTLTPEGGWTQGSYVGTFETSENLFLTLNGKYDSSGSSYPTEPTEVTVAFE